MLTKQEEENSKWRGGYEDINTQKVIEIHNALKLLNSNIGKVNSDAKDRFDMMTNDFRVMENAISVQIQDLRNKVEVDDNTLEQRIQLAVDRVYDKLKQSIDGAVLDYNKLVQEHSRMLSEKFTQNNVQVKSFIEQKTDEMRFKILEERRKLDTLVEGRC